jgi:hypothetical protein
VSVPPLCVAGLLAGSCSLIDKEEVVPGTYDLGSVTCLNRDAACADPYDRASDCLESPWIPDSHPVADGKGSCCVGGALLWPVLVSRGSHSAPPLSVLSERLVGSVVVEVVRRYP